MSETLADRRLHPATVLLGFLKNAPSTVLGLPAFLTFATDVGIGEVLLAAAGLTLVSTFANWLYWRSFRYGVGPAGVVIQSGILNRSRRTIPFERIQDVDIEQGPLARLFGLARLRIETGGADKNEGALDSVSLAEAERLRVQLKGRAGEAADVVAHQAAPLFSISAGRVLLSGLFNFSMVWLAGIFAILQTLDDFLPLSLEDMARMFGLTGASAAERFSPPVIAAAALLALLLGVVSGIVQTFARDYGFALTLVPEGLRRKRGLLTRSEVTIPRRRVQLGLVASGPIARALGWWSLSLQTLGGEDENKGKQAAAPFARLSEIAPILGAVTPLRMPERDTLKRVSGGHAIRKLILRAPLLLALAAVAAALPPLWPLLLTAPVIVTGALLERRAHRYALDGDMLFVERGLLKRASWLVPVASAQTISVSRSWLQRRLGIATLLVDTPGAAVLSDPRIVDLDLDIARSLAKRLRAA